MFGKLYYIAIFNADSGDADILFKSAVELVPDCLTIQAGIGSAPQAAAAVMAGDHVCYRYLLSYRISLYIRTNFRNDSAKLMANDGGIPYTLGLFTGKDTHIGTADGGGLHFQKDLVRADFRLGNVCRCKLIRTGKYNCSHLNLSPCFTNFSELYFLTLAAS